MKITLDLRGENLVAFERAFSRTGLTDDQGMRRYFAYSILNMATDCLATTAQKPAMGPVGRFEFRYWNHEEHAVQQLIADVARAERVP